MTDIMLHDTWTYRFHDPYDNDWTMPSYVMLADVSSVQDMWDVHLSVQRHVADGMFFVMRENVFPCWDDPANIHGGCISLKVLKTDVHTFWEELLIGVLGEVMDCDRDEDGPLINGISTSPKRFYCIVKLWLRRRHRKDFKLPCNYQGEVMYRASSDMIRDNLTSGATGRA